jgi:hypothetical protein
MSASVRPFLVASRQRLRVVEPPGLMTTIIPRGELLQFATTNDDKRRLPLRFVLREQRHRTLSYSDCQLSA